MTPSRAHAEGAEVIQVALQCIPAALRSDTTALRWWGIRCAWLVALDRITDTVAVPGAPVQVLAALENTFRDTPSLAYKLVLNPDCPGEIIDWALWLGPDEWHPNLVEAATHPNTLPTTMVAIARELLHVGSSEAHEALLRRPDVPVEVVEQLFTIDRLPDAYWDDEHPYVLPRAFLANPRHDGRLLADIVAAWLDPNIQIAPSHWPSWVTRAKVLPGHGPDDDSFEVPGWIASNPNVTPELQQRIVGTIPVWRAVAANPSSAPRLLIEADMHSPSPATARDAGIESMWWKYCNRFHVAAVIDELLASNPKTPAALLGDLAQRHPRLAARVAANPSSTKATWSALPARIVLNCRNQPDVADLIPAGRTDDFVSLAASTADAGPTLEQLLATL